MRLLISAAGTGGGVYPALAVLQKLQNKYQDSLEVIWVGAVNHVVDGVGVCRLVYGYDRIL